MEKRQHKDKPSFGLIHLPLILQTSTHLIGAPSHFFGASYWLILLRGELLPTNLKRLKPSFLPIDKSAHPQENRWFAVSYSKVWAAEPGNCCYIPKLVNTPLIETRDACDNLWLVGTWNHNHIQPRSIGRPTYLRTNYSSWDVLFWDGYKNKSKWKTSELRLVWMSYWIYIISPDSGMWNLPQHCGGIELQ